MSVVGSPVSLLLPVEDATDPYWFFWVFSSVFSQLWGYPSPCTLVSFRSK